MVVIVVYKVDADKTEYIYFKSDGIEITFYNYRGGEILRKDLIRVNEVKKKDNNVRGFATVVFGDSFKITNIALL